jgi:DNA-binding beta-propeller fold protein YncE
VKTINRQRLTSLILIVLIFSGFIFIWKMYVPENKSFLTYLPGYMPELEFMFVIGGEGAMGSSILSEPMAAAIADNGDIFVTDTLNSTIKIFDNKGVFKISFGGKTQLYLPTDIALDKDKVYVVDSKNSRIQLFDINGTFIKTFAGAAIGKQIGAWIPCAITIGNNNDVFVTDVFFHRVIVFDQNGKIKTRFGSVGNGQGQLFYPNGITTDKTGFIYVADSNNQRIQVFDSTGRFVNKLSDASGKAFGFGMPRGLVFGEQGFLYVVDSFSHIVRILEVNAGNIESAINFGTRGMGNEEFNFPNDVSISKDILCVADRANDRVLVFVIH